MEFFQKNPDNKLEQQLLAVFTDITCSELKPEATLEQINQLPGYFVNLATQLKNGTYDAWEKEFRIQDYQAYSDINVWADRLMTKHYSCLDNLTGIAVEANDEIIVLVQYSRLPCRAAVYRGGNHKLRRREELCADSSFRRYLFSQRRSE